jgi:catechol 2,3-dioxygenase-like lactoylglutathione lyase family enzyme
MKLAQIILFTRDIARLQAFYSGLFGFPPLSVEDGWVRLDAGGAVLALHAIPPHVAADDTGERDDASIKVCFHVDDVDATRATLVAAGIRMRKVHRYQDIVFCDGLDPDGNVFQITTR